MCDCVRKKSVCLATAPVQKIKDRITIFFVEVVQVDWAKLWEMGIRNRGEAYFRLYSSNGLQTTFRRLTWENQELATSNAHFIETFPCLWTHKSHSYPLLFAHASGLNALLRVCVCVYALCLCPFSPLQTKATLVYIHSLAMQNTIRLVVLNIHKLQKFKASLGQGKNIMWKCCDIINNSTTDDTTTRVVLL